MKYKRIIVTGGSGFIGSTLIKYLIKKGKINVLNIDKITYASNKYSLAEINKNKYYSFLKSDINNRKKIKVAINDFKPDAIFNLAAETHVDNSIKSSKQFIQSNILGTHSLLEEIRNYWINLNINKKKRFRLIHISTDEVFGDLGTKKSSKESDRYNPSSPYSASKASSDHLVTAWFKTYGLPSIITYSANNYGPFQYPEKLIPVVIKQCLNNAPIPVYGNGRMKRNWLHVEDHVDALWKILNNGHIGKNYNISGSHLLSNINLIKKICKYLDHKIPIQKEGFKSYDQLINFIKDRPGHDIKYNLNDRHTKSEIRWTPRVKIDIGLKTTIDWYVINYRIWNYKKEKTQ